MKHPKFDHSVLRINRQAFKKNNQKTISLNQKTSAL